MLDLLFFFITHEWLFIIIITNEEQKIIQTENLTNFVMKQIFLLHANKREYLQIIFKIHSNNI